jgi:hypothetical protein
MTVVRCPRCRDEVSVPAKASSQALVRCPLCLEEYVLAEALAHAPPALVVISGEAETQSEISNAAGAVRSGDDYRLAGVFDATAPPRPVAKPVRPLVKGPPRPRRRETSAVAELIKIVLGGVVGLSMGLLLLWWLARVDPLDLGPQVAQYAPWIVPARFHGKSRAESAEEVFVAPPPPMVASDTADAPAASPPANKRKQQKKRPADATTAAPAEPPQSLPELSLGRPGALADVPRAPALPKDSDLGGLTLDNPLDVIQPAAKPAPPPPAASESPEAPAEPTPQPLSRPPMPDLTDLLP